MRHLTFRGILSAIVVMVGASPLLGATLAHWNLGENTSGYVDPAAGGVQNNYNTVPGAPFAPSLDSAGNSSRDMARMRGDTGSYNYRNQVSYESFAGHTGNGFVGTATYHLPYPQQDLRGIRSGNDGTDVLTTRNSDAFTNDNLDDGFTYEVLWRPTIGPTEAPYQKLNFDGGGNVVMTNGAHAALASIEGRVEIGYRDGDPTAGVDPRIYFTITGSAGTAIETPLNLTLLQNDTDHFFHVVGEYDPTAVQTQRFYVDGVQVGSSNAFSLYNIDLNDGGSIDGRLSTIGGTLFSIYSSFAFIDAVRLSTGPIPDIHWLVPLPEPSSLGLVALVGLLVARRPRRSLGLIR
jgi:hypothetical protein